MAQWRPFRDSDTYYFLVDSKPDEIVKPDQPNTSFCTAFVSTSSSYRGVRESDLPWLKQYKESESLEESNYIAKQLRIQILKDNFFNVFGVGPS